MNHNARSRTDQPTPRRATSFRRRTGRKSHTALAAVVIVIVALTGATAVAAVADNPSSTNNEQAGPLVVDTTREGWIDDVVRQMAEIAEQWGAPWPGDTAPPETAPPDGDATPPPLSIPTEPEKPVPPEPEEPTAPPTSTPDPSNPSTQPPTTPTPPSPTTPPDDPGSGRSLLVNSGFEQGLDKGWFLGKTGRVLAYANSGQRVHGLDPAPGGGRQLYMKLPAEAKVNYDDQVSIGQDVADLRPDRVYRVRARVRWLNPGNRLPSAIVSLWAKHPDGTFSGKDFHVTDGNGHKTLEFEFTPNQQGQPIRIFMGLFTHIEGNVDATEIHVDDFTLTDVGAAPRGTDDRQGNLVVDGGFDRDPGKPGDGWVPTSIAPVAGLNQSVRSEGGDRKLMLTMPKSSGSNETLNKTVTGVHQDIRLVAGQRYRLSGQFQRLSLDRFGPRADTLVQFMVYKDLGGGDSVTLGPVDVILTDNTVHTPTYEFVAPVDGSYRLMVRLAGWANGGNGITVTADNIGLTAID